jgi:hypothetical protein
VFRRAAGKRDAPGSSPRRLEVFVQQLLELVVHGKLLFFAAFFFKAEQKPVPGWITVYT